MKSEQHVSRLETEITVAPPAPELESRTKAAPSDGRTPVGSESAAANGRPEAVLAVIDVGSRPIDWDSCLPERASSFRWKAGQWVKRVIDIWVALVALVLLLPVFLVIGLLIRMTCRGPAFYRWCVLGYRGRPFRGYKLRSMVVNAEHLKETVAHLNHMRGPAFKVRNDPRVTRLGQWLRTYSIDELPQFWSVLKGDMSLVGPRPPFPEEFETFADWHKAKLAVKPGITCLWQILGRSDIHDFDEWANLDLKYIEEWSLWLDFKILLKTIPAVIRGHGAY